MCALEAAFFVLTLDSVIAREISGVHIENAVC